MRLEEQVDGLVKDNGRLRESLDSEIERYDHVSRLYDETFDQLKLAKTQLTTSYTWLMLLVSANVLGLLYFVVPFGLRYVIFPVCHCVGTATLWVLSLVPRMWANFRSRAGYNDIIEEIPLLVVPPGQPEAVLSYSKIVNVPVYPSSLVKIYRVDPSFSDKIALVGMGAWVDTYILTAAHVLDAANSKVIHIANANVPGNWIRINTEQFERVADQDIAILRMKKYNDVLKITKAKTPGTALAGTQITTIYGKDLKASSGVLRPESFGLVVYRGSTLPGYSGSPYMVGNVAYGMHISSTNEAGYGFDMSYIQTLVMHMPTSPRLEASEDFLLGEIIKSATRTGKKYKYQQFGMDDVIVRFNGKYLMYDREDYQRLQDYLEEENVLTHNHGTRENFNDNDSVLPTVVPPVVSKTNTSLEDKVTDLIQLISSKNFLGPLQEALTSLEMRMAKVEGAQEDGRRVASAVQKKEVSLVKSPTSLVSVEPIPTPIPGPRSIPVVVNEVSPTTSTSSSVKKEHGQQISQLQKEIQRLRKQVKDLIAGGPPSPQN
uniref:Serine protease n=1 Tax=Riboviria sp. TaxID=2585031 RepID=A0A8K1U2D4_9VIRU|nr:MAG: hypothetical protein 2 [Riboviria sp.]